MLNSSWKKQKVELKGLLKDRIQSRVLSNNAEG